MTSPTTTEMLLIFRVGPVYCGAPVEPVESVVVPPSLSHPPGSTPSEPGIFRHHGRVVRVDDLRERFGVPPSQREAVGRLIVTRRATRQVAYWVDAIGEIIAPPASGWSDLPPLVPREVFQRAFVYQERVVLLSDFERLRNLRSGQLAEHLCLISHTGETSIDSREKAASATAPPQRPSPPVHRPQPEKVSDDLVRAVSDKPPPAGPEAGTVARHPVAADRSLRKARSGHTKPRPAKTAAMDPSLQAETASHLSESAVKPGSGGHDVPHRDGVDQDVSSDPPIPSTRQVTFSTLSARGQSVEAATVKPSHNKAAADQESATVSRIASPISVPTYVGMSLIVCAIILLAGAWVYLEQSPSNPTAGAASPTTQTFSSSTSKLMADAQKTESTDAVTTTALRKKPPNSVEPVAGRFDSPAITPIEPETSAAVDETVKFASPLAPSRLLGADEETEIVTEMTPPAEGASVSLHRDEEGYIIEIHEPRTFAGGESQPPNNTRGVSIAVETDMGEMAQPPGGASVETSTRVDVESQTKGIAATDASDDVARRSDGDAGGGENRQTVTAMDETVSRQLLAGQSPSPLMAKTVRRQLLIHVVIAGDTLWHIATRYLGDPFRYPELARASNIRNPDLIFPGDRVRIVRYY